MRFVHLKWIVCILLSGQHPISGGEKLQDRFFLVSAFFILQMFRVWDFNFQSQKDWFWDERADILDIHITQWETQNPCVHFENHLTRIPLTLLTHTSLPMYWYDRGHLTLEENLVLSVQYQANRIQLNAHTKPEDNKNKNRGPNKHKQRTKQTKTEGSNLQEIRKVYAGMQGIRMLHPAHNVRRFWLTHSLQPFLRIIIPNQSHTNQQSVHLETTHMQTTMYFQYAPCVTTRPFSTGSRLIVWIPNMTWVSVYFGWVILNVLRVL